MNVLVTTRTPRSGSLRALLATVMTLLTSVLVLGTGAPAAQAHTELVRTWPSTGTTVRDVDELHLRFGEPLMEGLAQVAVTGPGGPTVTGEPIVTGSDVLVPLRAPLEDGQYRVAYRVVAADGHTGLGEYGITVTPTPARAAEKQRAGDETPSTGPEGAGSARGPRSGAPEQLLPASSGAPVAPGGLDQALPGAGVAALVLLLLVLLGGVHLKVRRDAAPAGSHS